MESSLTALKLRLLEQCHKFGTHHLGSAFSTLPILKEIFDEMGDSDRLILSNGHAAAALYVALESYRGHDSELLFKLMGDHPKRDSRYNVDCSTGSLGMGITVAVGMAVGSPDKSVYCVVSDGECAEGSVWESLRFAAHRIVPNLKIYFCINNFAAYDAVDGKRLSREILALYPEANIRFTSLFPFDKHGLEAHYMKLDENHYELMRTRICDLSL
jgi:transketolase